MWKDPGEVDQFFEQVGQRAALRAQAANAAAGGQLDQQLAGHDRLDQPHVMIARAGRTLSRMAASEPCWISINSRPDDGVDPIVAQPHFDCAAPAA